MFNNLWDRDRRYRTHVYGNMEVIKQNINDSLFTVRNYYTDKDLFVRKPNILVTLINSLNIDFTKDPTDVFIHLTETAYYRANSLKLVTSNNKNSFSFNNTVIRNMDEYFIYTEDTFDYTDDINYFNLTPIKCIHNTLDHVFLTHPQKFNDTLKGFDYSIYSIDVIMLGMQYYHWYKYRMFMSESTDAAKFIYGIPLVNSINSIFDINLSNRFIRKMNDEDVSDYTNHNVFNLRDDSKRIDKLLDFYVKQMSKDNRIYYSEALYGIPLMITNNALDIINIPQIRYNTNNKWMAWLLRIDYFIFLLTFIDSKLNRDTISEIKMLLNYDIGNRVFDIPNKDLKFTLQEKIYNLTKLINKEL